MAELILSAPQNVFLNGLGTKFRAYVGGYGSGKTFVGCLDLLIFFSQHPGTRQGYFGTTYSSIRDIFFPTFEEAAHLMGFTCKINSSSKEIAVYRNGFYYGTVICRSMDKPKGIIGFKIARALVDEIDTLPRDKAAAAWKAIIARLRLKIDGVENGIGVTTTPEGYLFVYQQFALNPTPSYSMVQASSYENIKYLPPDYIPSLIETYGAVYKSFSRTLHKSTERIIPGEPLFIGCDFNVMTQAATVWVKRQKAANCEWHAVAELKNMEDTPHMIQLIDKKWKEQGHEIYIYPDASGRARKSIDAYKSDIILLEQAKYRVRVNKKNPYVNERVLSMNKCFEKGIAFINPIECPTVTQCIEQQGYDKNGQPDKSSGLDHQNDATTYPIIFEFPIRKPVIDIPMSFAV